GGHRDRGDRLGAGRRLEGVADEGRGEAAEGGGRGEGEERGAGACAHVGLLSRAHGGRSVNPRASGAALAEGGGSTRILPPQTERGVRRRAPGASGGASTAVRGVCRSSASNLEPRHGRAYRRGCAQAVDSALPSLYGLTGWAQDLVVGGTGSAQC